MGLNRGCVLLPCNLVTQRHACVSLLGCGMTFAEALPLTEPRE